MTATNTEATYRCITYTTNARTQFPRTDMKPTVFAVAHETITPTVDAVTSLAFLAAQFTRLELAKICDGRNQT